MITERLGSGYATYSNEGGKIQMIGYEKPVKSRFQTLLQMRRAVRYMGFSPDKSNWADGWVLRIPWPTGHPNRDTYLCATHTLYLDPKNRWSLYKAVSCWRTGNDLDDEKLITNNASDSEVQEILYAFQNPPVRSPQPDSILD